MWKFFFSKVTGWEPVTLLKMKLFLGFLQGFWLKVSPGKS